MSRARTREWLGACTKVISQPRRAHKRGVATGSRAQGAPVELAGASGAQCRAARARPSIALRDILISQPPHSLAKSTNPTHPSWARRPLCPLWCARTPARLEAFIQCLTRARPRPARRPAAGRACPRCRARSFTQLRQRRRYICSRWPSCSRQRLTASASASASASDTIAAAAACLPACP